jgi:DNA-binding NarL/FixJ family response regulator
MARAILAQEPIERGVSFGGLFRIQAEVEVLLAERRYDEALAIATQQLEATRYWQSNPGIVPWRSFIVQALDALGRSGEALPVIDEEIELARRWGAPGPIGRALRIRGAIMRDEGVDQLREAVEILSGSTMRLEYARALAALGGALRRTRQQSESREPLRQALELASACGAEGLASDVRSELAAAGVRPRTTALGGVESLTASEKRVTALAAAGQTNRDISQELYVTPKTVEVHLSNAYRKLGIRSRRELSGALEPV